ncbi:MAG: dihydrolipoyl dehydrogenase [Omnitrophica WOR_2 bacterium RIFCSPHIGHO2_02_FULL_67_20]|nr:MAG: dihydrolipoyl dehydrogenase [Omnitrophica WOR_2 bacterium RIFCSPHIGHO2_02_FULL_67_20]
MDPVKADIVVIGAGPGGYAAAFYAADKGRRVILVEQDARLGGVCLNRGCIPSKALLHATELMREAKELSSARGITFGEPSVSLEKLRAWKESVLAKLAGGIGTLAKARGVQILHGRGHFEDSTTLRVETSEGQKFLTYQTAIIAVGSKPAMPQAFDVGNPRIMTSTEALDLAEIPKDLLVVGGGYIGLELGTVFATLGSRIVLAEALDSILMGLDADLARPVLRYAQTHFKEVRLGAKVLKMATSSQQIKVTFEAGNAQKGELYDRVLVAVGRTPNCANLGLENTKAARNERGFIRVNAQQQTDDPAIYAIGDVVGGAMLAHKASKEARVAVEVITGESSAFERITIPAVVFTDPEVAWCGLTESEARARGIAVEVAKYPWSASGRALCLDRTDGLTKLVIEPKTERILGVGLVGVRAGELIGEGVLAIEMGATAKDLAESVHPHPTLSETLMEAAELFYGTSTHALSRRRPKPAQAER